MTFWDKLEKFPPVLVRLLAKRPDGVAMTDADVLTASRGFLSMAEIKRLSFLTDWDGVCTKELYLFTEACGVNLENAFRMRTLNRYLKDAKFAHLKHDKNFPHFKEMLRLYVQTLS